MVTIAVAARPATHPSRKSDGTGPTLAEVKSDGVKSVELTGGSHTSSIPCVALMVETASNVSTTTFTGVRPTMN